jgi:hypothetical protein
MSFIMCRPEAGMTEAASLSLGHGRVPDRDGAGHGWFFPRSGSAA